MLTVAAAGCGFELHEARYWKVVIDFWKFYVPKDYVRLLAGRPDAEQPYVPLLRLRRDAERLSLDRGATRLQRGSPPRRTKARSRVQREAPPKPQHHTHARVFLISKNGVSILSTQIKKTTQTPLPRTACGVCFDWFYRKSAA
jgi:hypothetical protein